MKIHKITDGCVTQVFEDGECISQQFHAFDIVEYEDGNSNPVEYRDYYHPFEMVQPLRPIKRYQVTDYGIEHEQYFQGCASNGFDNVVIGIGDNSEEAFNDCLEQIVEQGFDIKILEELERDAAPGVKEEDFHYYISIKWS